MRSTGLTTDNSRRPRGCTATNSNSYLISADSAEHLRYGIEHGIQLLPTALINVVLIALALALQEQYGIFVGWLGAVFTGVILCGILFLVARASYELKRKVPRSTDKLPIRRGTTVVTTPAAAASTEY